MSNHLAIATATRAFVTSLQEAMVPLGFAVTVRHVRPDQALVSTTMLTNVVNVFLYQVTPNAALRNADLPTRDRAGSLHQRPQAALDLHYLLTFHGSDNDLIPQKLLGATVRYLHSRPTLSRSQVLAALGGGSPVAGSDLADASERVRFTLANLSYEELSKLWSVFFQSQYVLSLACRASVVVIEGDQTPAFTGAVRERSVLFLPPDAPTITAVRGEDPSRPVIWSSTLQIEGERLLGDDTRVRIDGVEVVPVFASERVVAVPLLLPALRAAIRAGVHGVQVLHRSHEAGGREVVIESNLVPLVVHPVLDGVGPVPTPTPSGSLFDVTVPMAITPRPSDSQSVWLVLFGPAGSGLPTYVVRAPTPSSGAPWTAVVYGVRGGTYNARVRVDGVDSAPAATDVTVTV